MKDCDKNKQPLYLNYWDVNDLYAWAISQTLPVDTFNLVGFKSQFSKDFKENCNGDSDERCFLEVDV